jgi:signal transduction histidine kinase
MFKSIFSKLVAIFVLILMIAFSVTGIMLNFFLGDYMTANQAEILEASSDTISNTFSNYLKNPNNAETLNYFLNNLELFVNSTHSYIWFVDESGHIKPSIPEMPASIKNKYIDATGNIKLPDEKQYKPVMASNEFQRYVGDFYGFFKDATLSANSGGSSWLTVAKAYTFKTQDGSSVKIAIYMHTPVPYVQKIQKTILEFFLFSVGIAITISIIFIYIFSLRLSRPLKQIRNAAKIISAGEFTKRLDIKSKDEIGELAGTFNQMAAALQNLEDMRRGFIANVSHELRTPMTSIRGFIEGILDGTIPHDRQNYYLTIVRDETNRLNRLVNDLLDLAKMEAGEVTLNLRAFDINETVRRCVIKLETLLIGKDITVEADFEQEDMLVNADTDAIERVLYNLLHNAIKFSPESGNIRIATKRQKDKVVVSVKNDGEGIESSELDMIWERFYKSDKSRSKDKTGTGLGLAIVKNIINEHHQEIWVESELGKGAKFLFTLERIDESEAQENDTDS